MYVYIIDKFLKILPDRNRDTLIVPEVLEGRFSF